MVFRLRSRNVSAFKCLFLLAIFYGLLSVISYSVINLRYISPLGLHASLDRFSEARAIEHVRVLSKEIDGRQEGRHGLEEAANYIKAHLETLKERARSAIRVDVSEDIVSGSFNMMFLGHNISLGYRNHKNILLRISSIYSQDTEASVLVNGHFDSPLGSPGAGDCGSCVASMLEVARVIVNSNWVPPRPIIFLFNGAEELFLLGSHGFMKTHKWRNTIGAFINVEATGTGGPDLVCQSGPGSWPSLVYAESAIYPMALSLAQDFFPVIPGDTDFRIFSQDYGNIPGLDTIFTFGGYFYHTSYDTVERLIPGSIQARGENLLNLIKAFANSSKLQTADERESFLDSSHDSEHERAVFFDYLSLFMIIYPRRASLILHSIPAVLFFLMPLLLHVPNLRISSSFATLCDFMKGVLFHLLGVILGTVFPIFVAVLRLLFYSHAMSWFAHPYLAFLMFLPCSIVGLLIPRIVWRYFPLSQDTSLLKKSRQKLSNEAWFWGAFGVYAFITLVYTHAGLSGGFLAFLLSASMLLAWICFCISAKAYGQQSVWSILSYVVPLIPCLTYSVYFCAFLAQFLIERIGMIGSLHPPYGFFVPDVIVAAAIGLITGLCFGPLIPVLGNLARPSIVQFLLHLVVLSLAFSSQFFPYSVDAPKRVIFQHTFLTEDANHVLDSSYDFSVIDSNSLSFLFKNAPEAARELSVGPDFYFETSNQIQRDIFLALFPISSLCSSSLKITARYDDILKRYARFPYLSSYKPQTISENGSRKVYLEFYLGSLEEIWVAVLNITGPLSGWSFADNVLPAAERVEGGPLSYICRLSGGSNLNWTFWLEAETSEALRVDIAVLDQYLVDPAKRIKGLFPNWVDAISYSSFMSTYNL